MIASKAGLQRVTWPKDKMSLLCLPFPGHSSRTSNYWPQGQACGPRDLTKWRREVCVNCMGSSVKIDIRHVVT